MSDEDNIDRHLRKLDSQLKKRTDEALADLRNYWGKWDGQTKQAFKEWMEKAVALKKAMPDVIPYMSLRVEFSEQVADDEYHTFAPSLEAIRRAVESWERGEPYTPTSLGELA
jgi:hypothetical protein